MRKTASGDQVDAVLRERVEPLAAASVSTTVRLPVELANYVTEMVASGEARDKTDAIARCIRRHKEAQAGVSGVGRLEVGQAELSARLDDVAHQLQGLRDDLVMVGSRSSDGLAGLQQALVGLLAARLYGSDEQVGADGGGSMGTALPVKLMAHSAAATSTRRPKL